MKTLITRILTSMVLILALAASLSLLAASSQEGEEREETFTMVAVPTKGSVRATIDITMRINKFSTDQEVLAPPFMFNVTFEAPARSTFAAVTTIPPRSISLAPATESSKLS